MRSTVKAAKDRLARFEAIRVYSYRLSGQSVVRRSGAYSRGAR